MPDMSEETPELKAAAEDLLDRLWRQSRGHDEPPSPVSPPHYQAGDYELIDVLEAFGLHRLAYRFNAAQYIVRACTKNNGDALAEIIDLEKAKWYLEREISRLRREMVEAERG